MKRIGLIDIGLYSIKVMLSEIEGSGYFRIIDELQEPLKLGQDILENNLISEEKLNTAISILNSFKSLCLGSGVSKVFAITTEELQNAQNGSEVIEKISQEIDIKVLTPEDEIFYNHLGVKNSMYILNSLLIEINGTSTHLSWIKDNELLKSITLPIGSLQIATKFNLTDRIIPIDLLSAKDEIMSHINSVQWLKDGNFTDVIGLGGAFRNLAKMDRKRKRYPIQTIHNYTFSDIDIIETINILKSKDLKQRSKIDGLNMNRADTIVASCLIVKLLVTHLGINTLRVCGRGIREGMLFNYIINNISPIEDIIDYSITGIMETLHINRDHADHVYSITKTLFEKLKPLHRLGNEYSNIVKTSSLLHDSGISIQYYGHHKHSFYVILNSYMNGLTHKELLMSAFTAAFHRNNSYQIPLPMYSSVINRSDVLTIEKIGILLKIAESLDRNLEGAVKDIDVTIGDDLVKIVVYSSVPLVLELQQALKSKCKFKDIYFKDLEIENIVK